MSEKKKITSRISITAFGDGPEMRQEAERGDCLNQRRRRPALESLQHDRRAGHGKQEAHTATLMTYAIT